jgi:hypothetical protein
LSAFANSARLDSHRGSTEAEDGLALSDELMFPYADGGSIMAALSSSVLDVAISKDLQLWNMEN